MVNPGIATLLRLGAAFVAISPIFSEFAQIMPRLRRIQNTGRGRSYSMDKVMDPNLEDFYRRIARLEAAHARGLGFEAEGTLGRSHYNRPQRRKFSLVKPLLLAAFCVTGLKAVIHQEIGSQTYDARVTELKSSTGFDRIGGYLMTPDPATLWLSGTMDRYLPHY